MRRVRRPPADGASAAKLTAVQTALTTSSADLSAGAIAFVDVETTGGHPAWHRITEIAIVAMRDGVIEYGHLLSKH